MSIEYTPGPLLTASRTTPTALWNDSADPDELRRPPTTPPAMTPTTTDSWLVIYTHLCVK